MSSYLNIYLQEKGSDKKVLFKSYSRSTDMYSTFREEVNPPYIEGSDGIRYKELTRKDLQYVRNSLTRDIESADTRLEYLDKAAVSNTELIDEVMSWKDYKMELEALKHEVSFYDGMLSDMELGISGFSNMFCNID